MRKQGLPLQRLLTGDALTTIARDLHLADVASLYAAVGESQVSAQSVVQQLVAGSAARRARSRTSPRPPSRPGRRGSRPAGDPGVVVKGVSRRLDQAGPLLHPGARRRDLRLRHPLRRRVSVHREDCTNADDLHGRAGAAGRGDLEADAGSMFLVAIQVEALDRHKLLADVTRVLSEERVNILSATVTTTRDRVAVSRFTFEMADPKHLGHLLAAVRKVDGVYDAYRVTSGT